MERPSGTEVVEAWDCHPECPVHILDAQSATKADKGGASRFFYCAKASKSERNRGMPDGQANTHPTVKPLDLMRYLVKLVTPPGGTVLDPFVGSGTTAIAAHLESCPVIGIDRDDDGTHLAIAAQRLIGHGASPTISAYGSWQLMELLAWPPRTPEEAPDGP